MIAHACCTYTHPPSVASPFIILSMRVYATYAYSKQIKLKQIFFKYVEMRNWTGSGKTSFHFSCAAEGVQMLPIQLNWFFFSGWASQC